jgi:DNA topoisomerase VI subunit B
LLDLAKRKTAEADVKLDDRGRKVTEEEDEDFGDNVLIVKQPEIAAENFGNS